MPEVARKASPGATIATGRSDYPNQVNNVLCFPFIFRGALDAEAKEVNDTMKLACVDAIAPLARQTATADVGEAYESEQQTFAPEYLIPKPFDSRLLPNVAVAKAAIESGAARNLLNSAADGLEFGPILMGMANRAHIVTPAVTPRGLLNIAALAGADVSSCG